MEIFGYILTSVLSTIGTAAIYTFIILPNVIEKLISNAKSITEEMKDALLTELHELL